MLGTLQQTSSRAVGMPVDVPGQGGAGRSAGVWQWIGIRFQCRRSGTAGSGRPDRKCKQLWAAGSGQPRSAVNVNSLGVPEVHCRPSHGLWSQCADLSAYLLDTSAGIPSDVQGRAYSAGNNVSVWLSLMRSSVRAAAPPGRDHFHHDGQAWLSRSRNRCPLRLMVYALDGSKDDFVGRWIVRGQLLALQLLN